jgi:hypothetical protein
MEPNKLVRVSIKDPKTHILIVLDSVYFSFKETNIWKRFIQIDKKLANARKSM